MSETILFYSYHHGVGRSNIAANLSFLLAVEGRRVGILDTDTKSPIIHYLFGLNEAKITYSFNDYLWGKCDIEQAAYDITPQLSSRLKGQLFVIPANTNGGETPRQINGTKDADSLDDACHRLIKTFNLDALLIDAQPGLSEIALTTVTISDILVVVLRLNQRDYQDTSVVIELVRQLGIPRILLIVNEAPKTFDAEKVKAEIEKTFNCEVAAILPYVEEIMALTNKAIFAIRYANHPMTMMLKEITAKLII
jgi:MinD-like ATPase involved in chromosome partitioning or flagellar assembly